LPQENGFMNTRKLLVSKRGQSVVEMALITPLLLAALYVAMDFGILFFAAQYTQNAVREAARIGSIMPDCAIDSTVACVGTNALASCPGAATGLGTVVKEACDRLPKLITGQKVTVTLTGTYNPAICTREVTVTATGTYTYGLYRVMALIGMSVPPTTNITRSADARYQGQPVTVSGAC
jgi:Flp pilus assembly protein TadG